jgi:UDP-N-acetylmuramoyl-tripeptide--D-alanyl-D-alanine ligase
MIKKYFSMLTFQYERTLLYMLQQTEYSISDYLKWLHRTKDFRVVCKRGHMVRTAKVQALFLALTLFVIVYLVVVFWLAISVNTLLSYGLALVAVLILPIIAQYEIILPLVLGKYIIQKPREKQIITQATKILADNKSYKIAVVGSYGKTSAKEVLKAVLSGGKKVAATPGNANQPLSISRFVNKLDGDEDILIFELGEYRTGDIYEMCELVQPNMGLITGANVAHLEKFGSMENIIKTLFGVRDYLGKGPLYLNGDNEILRAKDDKYSFLYSSKGTEKTRVSNVKIGTFGTDFTFGKFKVHSQLLGRHNIGVVVAAIEIAKKLGLTEKQINEGLKNIKPFEHRMEPYILNGAIVIDDTYNGNIDGAVAGIELLKELDARRRIYITPGLVEQGGDTERVHAEIGKLLSKGVDKVILMKNSSTKIIEKSLEENGFAGELQIVENPLEFYENLDKSVATGDVVLMQNDWTDNYAYIMYVV